MTTAPTNLSMMDRAIRANVTIVGLDARGLYALVPGGDASSNASMTAAISPPEC